MIVRELLVRLGFSLNQGQLSKAEQSTQRLKEQANGAAIAFRNMFGAFLGFQGIQSLIATGDQVQSLQARIGMLPQTIEPAAVAFDKVAASAIEARSSLDAYGTLYTKIGNAAKDYLTTQEDVLNVTSTISKALVVGGATAAEAGSVMTQFAQALGSGTLQGDEFRAMAEAAPQYLDKLAETLGYPRAELKKLASEGKLTSKEVIEATMKMKDFFDAEMRKMPMTVGQATTIVGTKWSQMINRMNNESSFITKIANFILDGFDYIEKGITAVVDAFGGFGNMLRYIGIVAGVVITGKLIPILKAFRLQMLLAMAPMALWILAILGIAAAVDDFIVFLDGGNSVIGDFINYLNSGSVAATLLKLALMAVGAVIATILIAKSLTFIAVLGVMMAGFLQTAAAAVIAGAKIGLGILMAMGPIGLLIAAIAAIGAAFYLVASNWDTIVGFLSGVMDTAAQAVIGFWQPVQDWFSNFFGWFAEKYEAIKGFVAPAFGGGDAAAVGGVGAASMAPAAMGQGGANVQNNTNVQVTVPPGTTAEQAAFLQNAAQKSFGAMEEKKFARDVGVYAK